MPFLRHYCREIQEYSLIVIRKLMTAAGCETTPLTENIEKRQERTRLFQVTSTTILILWVCGIVSWFMSGAIVYYGGLEFFRGCKQMDDWTSHRPKAIEPDSRPLACKKRLIGYYSETESVDVTQNQLEKLTHAVFAYIHVNWDGTLMFSSESANNKFVSLRKKAKSSKSSVKVMFSIGGEHNSEHFSTIAPHPAKRKKLVESIISILSAYEMHGVDIYWKYAKESDKFNYISLLRDLRFKLNEYRPYQNYTVSITLPAARIENWELAYDLDQTLEYVDFINVYSMDYYGPWEHRYGDTAGPSAPLRLGFGGRRNFNVHNTTQYYVCKTKQAHKFNIAIPFYAMLWRNVLEKYYPQTEAIRRVELKDNKAEGKAYMSRIQVEQDRWKLGNATWDEGLQSSYIWVPETRTYLTFESKRSLAAKIDYVNSMNLGGVWIWSVDMDDEQNTLLNTLSSKQLCSNSSGIELIYDC